MAPHEAPLISLDRIAVRQRDRWLLNGLSWRIHAGEQWVVTGPNGAGKTTLAKAIAGRLPVVQGRVRYHAFPDVSPMEAIAYVASDARRDIWRREREMSFSRDFAGRFNDATSTHDFLEQTPAGTLSSADGEGRLKTVAADCSLGHLLERPLTAISTGEMSRVLIARQLMQRPRMLILDEPFDGLDASGRRTFKQMLERLAGDDLPIILITHRAEERLDATTHRLTLADGRIVGMGPLSPSRMETPHRRPMVDGRFADSRRGSPPESINGSPPGIPLIDMQAVTVRFGEARVLDRVTWRVRQGEHWAVTGDNGAGKTTLLNLITGDCLQVHANRIRLFGRTRGPDQPLAAVRRELGVVSPALAAGYQKQMSVLDVVCSGFFDSTGLYRRCDTDQIAAARRQLERMGVAALAQIPFNHLSQGQRQMVLIARAMVKQPRLLLLDEPLSGLDPENRERILALLTAIGRSGKTGLIVVSHHRREIPHLTTHHLILARGRVVYCGPVANRP